MRTRKRLKFSIPSSHLSLKVRTIIFRLFYPLTWKSGVGRRIKLHDSSRNRYTPPGPSQVHGARWNPSKGAKEAVRSDCRATFRRLSAFLANRRAPRGLEVHDNVSLGASFTAASQLEKGILISNILFLGSFMQNADFSADDNFSCTECERKSIQLKLPFNIYSQSRSCCLKKNNCIYPLYTTIYLYPLPL